MSVDVQYTAIDIIYMLIIINITSNGSVRTYVKPACARQPVPNIEARTYTHLHNNKKRDSFEHAQ